MKKLLLTMILLCGALMGQDKATDANTQAALTIYNQNFFVAREYVPLDLTSGVNRAQYAGIASHLEPDSVILRDPAGRALQVLEQNYRNDPISQELLLSFMRARRLSFWYSRTRLSKAKSCAAVTFPVLTTRKTTSSLLTLSPSSKWTACCASDCPASHCFRRSPETRYSNQL